MEPRTKDEALFLILFTSLSSFFVGGMIFSVLFSVIWAESHHIIAKQPAYLLMPLFFVPGGILGGILGAVIACLTLRIK